MADRLRLLVVAEQLRRAVPGGIGTYTKGLVRGLAELGTDAPDVSLWASRARGRGPAPDPVADLSRPLETSRLPGPLLTRAWDRGLCPAPAGFDVVHATSLAVPRSRDAPMTVMVHDLAWREVPSAYPRRGRRWHEAAWARARARATLLLAPSTATARALVAAGADAGRVEIVEEGCDHLPAPDAAAASSLLETLGVRGPYLLTVGTLQPRKNLARLLAAYTGARVLLPEPWPLVVVGPRGWGRAMVPPPGAVLAGHVEDAVLSALYGGARCVAYVPLVEGFGLPAVEAMAAGVPVVASPMPSTGGAALEVDPVDIQAMAEALVRASSDKSARSELIAQGRARAAQLSWKAAARRHAELWRALT